MRILVQNIKELLVWGRLHLRLEQARFRGVKIKIWIRDDDAIEFTRELSEFLEAMHDFPISLAVIPGNIKDTLVNVLKMHPRLTILQHGWMHENRSTGLPSEFPDGLEEKQVVAELKRGYNILNNMFPEHYYPIFVPPWNRIGDDIVEDFHQIPLGGLSVFGNDSGPISITNINTHVDIMDWQLGTGQSTYMILKCLINEIELRLEHDVDTPIGILTHHLKHDLRLNTRLKNIVTILNSKQAVDWLVFPPRNNRARV